MATPWVVVVGVSPWQFGGGDNGGVNQTMEDDGRVPVKHWATTVEPRIIMAPPPPEVHQREMEKTAGKDDARQGSD